MSSTCLTWKMGFSEPAYSTMLPLSQARWLPRKILFGRAAPRKEPSHRGAFPKEAPIARAPTPPMPLGAEPLKLAGTFRFFHPLINIC